MRSYLCIRNGPAGCIDRKGIRYRNPDASQLRYQRMNRIIGKITSDSLN